MASSISPLLSDNSVQLFGDYQSEPQVFAPPAVKTAILSNGTFETGLELPLLDDEFDHDGMDEPDTTMHAAAHLFGGQLEWHAND